MIMNDFSQGSHTPKQFIELKICYHQAQEDIYWSSKGYILSPEESSKDG